MGLLRESYALGCPSQNNNIFGTQLSTKKNMYTDDKKIRDFMHSAVRCYFIPKLPSLFSHLSVHIRMPTKPKKFGVSLAQSPSLLFQWIKLSFFW